MEGTKLNIISQLKSELHNYIKNDDSITIHLHTGNLTVRTKETPWEFNIDENNFCSECGWFCLDLKHGIDNIEYYDEQGYDSFYIKVENIEIILDFV